MQKDLHTLLIIGFVISAHISSAHPEVVGEIVFENLENQLYATAKLEKRSLAGALKAEGECAPSEMLSVCGDQYVQENLQLIINGQTVTYEKSGMEIQKDHVIFTYKVNTKSEDITKIEVESNYLFKYNDHAVLRITFAINDTNKVYNIRATRRHIEASFI